MTTFTSDDREEEYKKILAEAPNQPGYEDAVPIPEDIKALQTGLEFYKKLKGDNASPPHIVDSGASVMGMTAHELADFVEISKPDDRSHQLIATMLRQQQVEIKSLRKSLDVSLIIINELEEGLESSINLNKVQAERNNEK